MAAKKATPKGAGRKRSPPFEAYPEWTTSRFFSFLRSGLRGTYSKWPPKWEVLRAAKREYDGPDKRRKFEYQCAECSNWYPQKEVSVDHIVPAGSLNTLEDLPKFVEKLFVPVEGLQVLCKTCHQIKTNKERKDKKESQ